MAPFKRYEQLSELVMMYPCLPNKQEKDLKIFLTEKHLFCFLFSSWCLLHRCRTKANDARSSERRLHAISIFSQKNFFLLSLVIRSVWWEWVGDRNLLGDIKTSPWKCHYCLRIKVAIVLISISKKVSPGGNQAQIS